VSSAEREQGLIPVQTHPTGDQEQATERVATLRGTNVSNSSGGRRSSTAFPERPNSCSDSPVHQ
jgi:hypothetical protein